MPRDEAANSDFFNRCTAQQLFHYYQLFAIKFGEENKEERDGKILNTNLVNGFTEDLEKNQFFAREDRSEIIVKFLFYVMCEYKDWGADFASLLLKSLKPLVDGNALEQTIQTLEIRIIQRAAAEEEVIREDVEENVATKTIPKDSEGKMMLRIIKEIKDIQKTAWEEKDEEREKKDAEEESIIKEYDSFLDGKLEALRYGEEPFKSKTRPLLKPIAVKPDGETSEQISSSPSSVTNTEPLAESSEKTRQ